MNERGPLERIWPLEYILRIHISNSRNRKEGREGDAMSAVRGEIKRAAARSINVNDPRAAVVYTD